MTDTAEKLAGKRESALLALLSNSSIRDAAKASHVSEATLYRYLREPEFLARFRSARRDVVEHAVSRLQSDASHMAGVLRKIADDEEAPASARVAAARTVIEQSIKAVELVDLAERVEALEQMTKGMKGKR